ncbi:DNA-binding MarR family transcriptional regulator [Scopulibacillus darangshiensis]|uniref:DNA-binding MarR family transcriptional regulator n=1 Tax=Scopulibacillus darangshiensis TaxID=442528 RepID=A0A4R2P5C9_9BACL|nr:MarR family transcriptional regulator [Scopulibacillus darangshiensis]TCP29982.1 DNA-binding MarR family transcriptional regulator [Scopulibacillus darangshiensis]
MVSIEDLVGITMLKSSKRLTRLITMHLKPYNITSEQWIVLKRVSEADHISQKELSQRSDKDQATLTKILDLLEKNGYVSRKPNPDDRRSFLICISDSGKSLKEELFPFIEHLYSQIISDIPEEQMAVYQEVLQKIQCNIEDLKYK